jgi:tetratricopeptide (TPR) repeat protein
MKKLVFASAMALASVSLVSAPALRAQDNSDQITIQNPAEFNAYQQASTQTDPSAKAAALESFLETYPQSVVKKAVLDELIVDYQQLNQPDKALSAATRLLQIDPNNMRAVYISVYIKKNQCQKSIDPSTGVSNDPQTCDDAATLAQKGLTIPKPAGTSDDDWKKLTSATYPAFDSAIALDDEAAKKGPDGKADMKDAIQEYRTELMLYPPEATKQVGPGLADTLQLAEAYAKPEARDEVQAIWFYARAWNFAPPAFKAQIEPKLEYWYKRFHGGLDGLDAVKTAAAQTLFPPADFTIKPAPTPPDIVHNVLATTPDLTKLNLEDKEFILANGTKDDAQKLWAVLQGQVTPVPGIVISDPATVLKVSVTTTREVKPKDYVVKLNTPADCSAVPEPPSDLHVKEAQAYILANGQKADTDAMGDDLTAEPAHIRKIVIEPAVTVINVAVTQDAKDNKTADFVVNLKDPESCKDAPAAGVELKTQPALELDGTYDTYTPVPATATRLATAQIVLGQGFLQLEKKAAPVVHHKPAAGHHAGR